MITESLNHRAGDMNRTVYFFDLLRILLIKISQRLRDFFDAASAGACQMSFFPVI